MSGLTKTVFPFQVLIPSTSSSSESEVSDRGTDDVLVRAECAVVLKLLTGRGFGAILDRSLGERRDGMVSVDMGTKREDKA